MTYTSDSINKGHTVYFKNSWTDPEPDTFYMSLESARPHSEMHIVVSGCATWLKLEQAKEVYAELGKYINHMEKRVARDEKVAKRKEANAKNADLDATAE